MEENYLNVEEIEKLREIYCRNIDSYITTKWQHYRDKHGESSTQEAYEEFIADDLFVHLSIFAKKVQEVWKYDNNIHASKTLDQLHFELYRVAHPPMTNGHRDFSVVTHIITGICKALTDLLIIFHTNAQKGIVVEKTVNPIVNKLRPSLIINNDNNNNNNQQISDLPNNIFIEIAKHLDSKTIGILKKIIGYDNQNKSSLQSALMAQNATNMIEKDPSFFIAIVVRIAFYTSLIQTVNGASMRRPNLKIESSNISFSYVWSKYLSLVFQPRSRISEVPLLFNKFRIFDAQFQQSGALKMDIQDYQRFKEQSSFGNPFFKKLDYRAPKITLKEDGSTTGDDRSNDVLYTEYETDKKEAIEVQKIERGDTFFKTVVKFMPTTARSVVFNDDQNFIDELIALNYLNMKLIMDEHLKVMNKIKKFELTLAISLPFAGFPEFLNLFNQDYLLVLTNPIKNDRILDFISEKISFDQVGFNPTHWRTRPNETELRKLVKTHVINQLFLLDVIFIFSELPCFKILPISAFYNIRNEDNLFVTCLIKELNLYIPTLAQLSTFVSSNENRFPKARERIFKNSGLSPLWSPNTMEGRVLLEGLINITSCLTQPWKKS